MESSLCWCIQESMGSSTIVLFMTSPLQYNNQKISGALHSFLLTFFFFLFLYNSVWQVSTHAIFRNMSEEVPQILIDYTNKLI